MDLSKPKALKVVEAILSGGAFTQYGLWKKAGVSFGTAHNVVKYLEQKGCVGKVGDKYAITSWYGLLGLFHAYYSFPKSTASFQLAAEPKQVAKYLSENGCVLCLTTAWQHYDDYLHDRQVHAYLPSKHAEIISELSTQPKGNLPVSLYLPELPVEPVKSKGLLMTRLPRTLLDMYSSHYSYGTSNWISKQAKAMK